MKRKLELRAEVKKLKELRAEAYEKLNEIMLKAEKEVRALTTEEAAEFDKLEKQIKEYDETIKRQERARKIIINETGTLEDKKKEERAENEAQSFAKYLRGATAEERAAANLTASDNGAVIPATIANKIIEAVIDISPVFALSDVYRVNGKLTVPYYDETTNAITMAYTNEFSELTSASGKFINIDLDGYLAGCLTKISKSLINNSNFDIVSFVIKRMSVAIAKFIEHELLIGTSGKTTGLSTLTNAVITAKATAVSTDDLINLQESIADAYQASAVWVMNKSTRTALRKLKDNEGRYILNPDVTAKWGYTLFGKDVYCSDNMPAVAAGKTTVYYGDFKGLAVKVSEDVSIQVLKERFATEHVDGVVAWIELDAKVQNAQAIAKLTQAAS